MRKRFTGVVESELAPCALWVRCAPDCASTRVVDHCHGSKSRAGQKRRWGEFLAICGHLPVRGAHLCVHVLGGGDHPVVILDSVEMHRVCEKCRWGAFLALCGLQCLCRAHPCDHLSGDNNHPVTITRRAETHRGSVPSYLWTQIDEWSTPVRPHTGLR